MIEMQFENTMVATLGIDLHIEEYEYALLHKESIRATMPVDSRTATPFGTLSGGASLALAETLAGFGSAFFCCSDEIPCGIQVSANHIGSAVVGEKVEARGNLIHKGKSTHLWDIEIRTQYKRLISTVRVTNMIIKKDNKG